LENKSNTQVSVETLNPSELKAAATKWFANPGLINLDRTEIEKLIGHTNGGVFAKLTFGSKNLSQAIADLTADPIFAKAIQESLTIIINVEGSGDLELLDFQNIVSGIADTAHPGSHIMCGMSLDESLAPNIQVTALAL
jgi:cell division GTPase FtsZ